MQILAAVTVQLKSKPLLLFAIAPITAVCLYMYYIVPLELECAKLPLHKVAV